MDGLVLHAGTAHGGSTHDLTALRRDDPDLGRITESMKDAGTPGRRRVTLYADLGYAGVGKTYPGSTLMQPEKKRPGRMLTARQKRHNRRVSRTRVRVEHAIGRIRRFNIPSRPYDGTPGQLGDEIQVATGPANFHVLWDKKDKKLRLGFRPRMRRALRPGTGRMQARSCSVLRGFLPGSCRRLPRFCCLQRQCGVCRAL